MVSFPPPLSRRSLPTITTTTTTSPSRSMPLRVLSQFSPLCKLPHEVLAQIALEAVRQEPLGPPAVLANLMLTCRYVRDALYNKYLMSLVYKHTYDVGAPRRRVGKHVLHSDYPAQQLVQNTMALKRIRAGDIYAPTVEDDLWTAFILLSENDGHNRAQLEHAGLPRFVDAFVRGRLWEGINETGWPAESPINALALWCMWMTLDAERLEAESVEDRQQIINLLRPYVLMTCRYASFQLPDNHFAVPLEEDWEDAPPQTLSSAHGPWPHYRDRRDVTVRRTHFGQPLNISVPLPAVAARLLFFSRKEMTPFGVPPNIPLDRAHARALGHGPPDVLPTQADLHEYNAYKHARLPPRSHWDWFARLSPAEQARAMRDEIGGPDLPTPSARWDDDWFRWTQCYDPWRETHGPGTVYTRGLMPGLWQGRMLQVDHNAFLQLVQTERMPAEFGDDWPWSVLRPLYMRLREYHCISPEHPIWPGGARDGFDDGIANGWFPASTEFREQAGTLTVRESDHGEIYTSRYELYTPGKPNSHDEDTCRLCLERGVPMDEDELEEDEDAALDNDAVPPPNTPSPPPTSEPEEEEWDPAYDPNFVELTPEDCRGIVDTIFVGEMDAAHGQAWHFYRHFGRVRPYDGLITIVRDPIDRRNPRFVLRGYVVGGQNFVGTWRATTADVRQVPWEGPTVMSRRD